MWKRLTATVTETVTETVQVESDACGGPVTPPCDVRVPPESELWYLLTALLLAAGLIVAVVSALLVTTWGSSGD